MWHRYGQYIRQVAAAIGLLATLLISPLVAAGGLFHVEDNDPGLEQEIDAAEQLGDGKVVRDDGHVDFGPTTGQGAPLLLIRDDSGDAPLWRKPEDVVLYAKDNAKTMTPSDAAYSFIGAVAGEPVWVLPQTQQVGTVWPGWNTQEPALLAVLGAGVKMDVLAVRGPGEVSVYLQSGNFSEPDLLWSTTQEKLSSVWIEKNSHVHANWVFTKPGAYAIDVAFQMQMADGSTQQATGTLQFAVGDETDPLTAFTATGQPELPAAQQSETGAQDAPAQAGIQSLVVVLIAVVGAVLLGAIVLILVVQARAKKLAKAEFETGAQTVVGGDLSAS
ncbi:choice-of-anchor M domain-containing protein [Canibacter sp. lx-72]|uniref:choice-of-anchor M domain-containing protein n=1 Tax=Canibacter zhuwentaonis TaxID=2837491 RepID=UPI001BDD6EA1|nr:choice-of-anchor M domain-containing protein [Canibacter zhuwentaonis]MBT1018216.1 choice-of-anchor M domain-containing protein [Canibacter zhuwentaonis]